MCVQLSRQKGERGFFCDVFLCDFMFLVMVFAAKTLVFDTHQHKRQNEKIN